MQLSILGLHHTHHWRLLPPRFHAVDIGIGKKIVFKFLPYPACRHDSFIRHSMLVVAQLME